ncbi:hypothetical protein BCV70DRAFT_197812 [Testicularia cyperi]|uniref:Chitinase n=1 Tax=Testicularia cyperi TaxID=1882483 RepID=A0A317Y085_9BASI|nr:hypothetical protein BCV70DRAFT_197812 [Testicularia cyperi]
MRLSTPSSRPPRRGGLLGLTCLILVSLASSSLAALSDPPTAEELVRTSSARYKLDPELIQHKQNPTLPVLGYVTPWNSRGKQLVSQFRSKFDLVSPVWYTILAHTSELDSRAAGSTAPSTSTTYKLSGAPPSPEDEEWYLDLQDAQKGSVVQVVPRFYLDAWQQIDYSDLLSNSTLWTMLSNTIVDEVLKKGYDGAVFESAATYLLFEPLRELANALHSHNKTLVAVLPPIRTLTSQNIHPSSKAKLGSTELSQNRMLLQSLPQLTTVVDWFSIMTYDMSGQGGQVSNITGKHFPHESPLRQAKKGSLRQAGPNTNPTWIRENVDAMANAATPPPSRPAQTEPESESEPEPGIASKHKRKQTMFGEMHEEMQDMFGLGSDPSDPFNYDEFGSNVDEDDQDEQDSERLDGDKTHPEQDSKLPRQTTAKFLMGLPMYGYRYPLFFIDKTTGQGVPLRPPSDAQEFEVRQGDDSTVPFLRGPGEALTMPQITELIQDHDGYLAYDAASAESFFDYLEQIPLDSKAVQHGVRPGEHVYWRIFLPTRTSMQHRLASIHTTDPPSHQPPQVGVSLWEVGQASKLLLADL